MLFSSCIVLPVMLACSADRPLAARADTSVPAGQVSRSAQRWSDPATWPGRVVPGEGAAVTIPSGREILLDISTARLASVRIDGTLRFADADLELTARAVNVYGRLEIGTEARPFTRRATITLVGEQTPAALNGMGTKLVGVMSSGTLELHGAARTPWLRLAENAAAGATQLVLESVPDDWRAADRLVIASTDRDPSHAEVVTIASVAGTTVRLAAPLRHAHWGTLQTVAGRQVDERAEVGLLTRNVVIRGDSASSAGGFGGHVMVMAGGVAHVEGVGLYYMGQLGLMARYPMHWHMAGDVSGQYVRNTSVWHSFNRCVTVHGSHAATVENNVCYDHVGHGYFLEDGIETRNTIVGNLGLGTHANAEGLPLLSDGRPATFWITNPDNTVRGNVAAGSPNFGFWYAMPEHPTGFSATAAVTPNRLPIREFRGNVTHSAEIGLYVDERPLASTGTESSGYYPVGPSGDVTGDFQDLRAFKNARGVWTRGRVRLLRPLLSDNVIGATLSEGPGQIIDPFVVGETQNAEAIPSGDVLRGFQFYDGPSTLRGGTFANFTSTIARRAGALAFLHDNWAPMSGAHTSEGVRFENANPVFAETPVKDGDKAAVFTDRDGSVTGTPGSAVIADNPVLVLPQCARRAPWNALVCPGARYSAGLIFSSIASDRLAPMTVRRDDGASMTMAGTSPRHLFPTLPVNREYTISMSAPMSEVISELYQLHEGEWITYSVPFAPGQAYGFITGRALPRVSSLAGLRAATTSTVYHDAAARRVYLKLFGTPSGFVHVNVNASP